MNKKMLSLALMTAIAVGAQAKVKLPHLVSDNMVIQQQSDVRLWGWAKPGKTVVATTSWSNERSETKVDKDGRWLLTVKAVAHHLLRRRECSDHQERPRW